jgi:hypothetical protein
MNSNSLSINDFLNKKNKTEQKSQDSPVQISDKIKSSLGKSLIAEVAKTPEEIQAYIKENKDMLYRMVKLAKSKGLKIRAHIPKNGDEWTFACSLGEAGMQFFDAYVRGKISFESIPNKYFTPKYIEYCQQWMETKTKKIIWPLIDHELQHAESSDYADIIQTARWEYENKLPGGTANRFFNAANEDPYIGNLQSSKWYGKHKGVEDLYEHFYGEDIEKSEGVIDLTSKYKMNQLAGKMQYMRLSRLSPEKFSIDIKVDNDVQYYIDQITPIFDELISANIVNSERVKKKNDIFRPIILDLSQKDIERAKQEQAYKKLLEQQNPKKESNSNTSDQQNDSWNAEAIDKEREEWSEQTSTPESTTQDASENTQSHDKEMLQWPLSQEEIQEIINQMTPEEQEELRKEAIQQIEEENTKQLQKDMPGVPQPLKGNEELENQPQYPIEQLEREPTPEEQKSQEEVDKLFQNVEQRMDDEELQKQLEKQARETLENNKDLEDFQEAQKKINELEKQAQNDIKTPDLQEEIQKKINQTKKQLQQSKQTYTEKLTKQGFDITEEEYYKEYITLEKSMDHQVEGFLRDLERIIPKIKEYSFSGYHTTGRIKDVVRAWIKLRQHHYDELYHKKEESESLKINLGICLSIDVSGSMDKKMDEVKQLTVFLGLLCQKRGIPFSVNAFGEGFHEIKNVKDPYERQKGKIMKLADHSELGTNISLAVCHNLKTIKQQERERSDITFLPIFITDWWANEWLVGDELATETKKFKGLELVFGLELNENEKSEVQSNFPRSKPIFLDDANQILTKWKQQLIKYFERHKDNIFKK